MDAIADTAIVQTGTKNTVTEDPPSLLAIVLETNPLSWASLKAQGVDLKHIINLILVTLNAHLASNNLNQVILVAAHLGKAQFLFPDPEAVVESALSSSRSESPSDLGGLKQHLKNKYIYRQFRVVDETVYSQLETLFFQTAPENLSSRSTVPSGVLKALTYINRLRQVNEGQNTNARVLVVSAGGDDNMEYIPTMNTIFAAQSLKIPIDVCKVGHELTFLQQAADVTKGVYHRVPNDKGLIQYLSTLFSLDPSIRDYVSLPTNNKIDFRASCFLTGQVVDVGYVCSVCLCVLSIIPEDGKCPTCECGFDKLGLEKLQRKPVVKKKKAEQ